VLVAGVRAMGERVVAALVPPRLGAGVRRSSSAPGRLPVVALLSLPRAGLLRYAMARLDVWGVVSNRATIDGLGWRGGDRLHITVVACSVVVQRHSSGAFVMPNRPYVAVPATVRHHSGLGSGAQVLLVADPEQDALVIHPLSAVDAMITAYHATLAGGEPS
jgi:bifunctional DNA-binding transcriptional regulator/antitoxin component of YhaV-PrlF toxin-antitoxin module